MPTPTLTPYETTLAKYYAARDAYQAAVSATKQYFNLEQLGKALDESLDAALKAFTDEREAFLKPREVTFKTPEYKLLSDLNQVDVDLRDWAADKLDNGHVVEDVLDLLRDAMTKTGRD